MVINQPDQGKVSGSPRADSANQQTDSATATSMSLDAFGGDFQSNMGRPGANNVTTTETTTETPPSDQPDGETSSIWHFLASSIGRKLAIALKVFFILVIIVVLIIQQIQFRNTWGRQCDYAIKIWSTVWLGRSLFQHILVLIISCLSMSNRGELLAIMLRRLQTLTFLFKFCWFLYGIKPVLVDPKCDHTSETWGLVLWWLEFALAIAPCVLMCLIFPIVLCCFWRNITASPDRPQRTPDDVRDKLKIVSYSEIADELEAMELEAPSSNSTRPEITDEAGIFTDVASTLTGVPLPDMSQLMRIQSGILGRQQSGSQPPQRASSGTQPVATVVGNQLSHQTSRIGSVTCPICFSSFELKDEVVQMPCDRRHVYHKECLFAWLEQSQQCPVCRTNVVTALEEASKNGSQTNPPHTNSDSTNTSFRKDSIV